MKRLFLYIAMVIMLYGSHACNKEDHSEILPNDPLYPTTINRLPEATLQQMRNDFAQRNPNVTSGLNQFGFCALVDANYKDSSPGDFTKEEAIAAVKDFVKRNPEYTGVSNPDDLHFRDTFSFTAYNNAVCWHFRTENQTINNTEIEYAEIAFNTQSRSLESCYGNYFPNVYIPEKFNFDIEHAKSTLLGKEFFLYGWAGRFSAGKVKTEDLQGCAVNLIIVPLTTDDKIELHVAWKIHLNIMPFILSVDVMTGEIVEEIPTVVS